MADIATDTAVRRNESRAGSTTSVVAGQPTEQLQVEEANDEQVQYPTGPQLWLNAGAMMLVCFLHGLDLTIVAPTVPSLTNEFKTVADIGWYSAVYGLVLSATNFFFGKLYTLFDLKKVYVASVATFELGSVMCTFAPSSIVFILGRAVAGLGAGGQGIGVMTFISRSFPVEKRPMMNGIMGFAQSFGLVSAPAIGGALIDAFSWRVCYGINIPLGVIAILISLFWMKDLFPNPDLQLPLPEKLRRLDPVGTILVLPCVVCLLLALIWGGTKFAWNDWRVILLFVLFAVLSGAFGYVQYRQQEKAILPPRIMKNRTVLASAVFSCCTNGILAVTEYYIAIYFQGVQGYSAARAGLLGLPMIVGLAVTSLLAALSTGWIGYYTPFLFATSIFAPIASGLLTTLDLDDSPVKVAALLGFLGVAVGFGIQQPVTAIMTVLSPKDIPLAVGVLALGSGLGSSAFIATSATLFQNRLVVEIAKHSPGTNTTILDDHGLSDLRKVLGPDRLKDVLFGYNEAVIQTLYLPLGLGLLTIVGSTLTEVKSVKKKD
ncbi:hypothetical protein G647_08577 [Cladophialophora carrionii CBS 160.54]|uniref:Major facilitator superfamily (MFS) profile domain-containing protein n=1 Tax=Cladophialophora carrionii CBS 160.54 TaxID=1279043 RepID=V9D0X8_9EURO|nr:uncharacterized protein G647_08577 [Cladophialophora carrionii CBS 160.54]ETI20540.1 hypothetical protein G647_08577 [Cladophialophora carrionii CBS 160.54]